MLSETRLQHLHILQNRYTPVDVGPVDSFDWKHCVKTNPTLRVHLRVESVHDRQVLWQPSAPVSSIIYKSPNTQVSARTNQYVHTMYASHGAKFYGTGAIRIKKDSWFRKKGLSKRFNASPKIKIPRTKGVHKGEVKDQPPPFYGTGNTPRHPV